MKSTGGILLLAAALLSGSSCARPDWIERTLVTVDVTGVWSGTAKFPGGLPDLNLSFELKQEGPKVKGSVKSTGWFYRGISTPFGPVEGTVSGDRLEFRQTNGPFGGELTVGGDEMAGPVHGLLGPGQLTLRRVNSPPPEGSLKP